MAEVAPIPNPSGWLSILNRLGIPLPPQWKLSDTVIPVALVDTSIVLSSVNTPILLGSPASAGESIAPAANTRLADTGALAAGTYTFTVNFNANEGNSYRVRRRNAADAADIWSMRYSTGTPGVGSAPLMYSLAFRTALAANERIVVENVIVGTAAIVYQAQIFATLG